MNKPKIVVTGSNGQLGRELQAISSLYPEFEFIFFSREQLPVHEAERVQACFANIRPQYCINCAAYTAVDKAETEKDLAFLVNGASTGILAKACNTFNTKFIHISTDYVFNGLSSEPYKEDHKVDPVNTYGASKLNGEELAIYYNSETIIIRTSWVYSEFGNNFVKTMMRLMKDRETLGIVNDQVGAPTYAADLAKAILEIIKSPIWKSGIYHYSNEGIITWFQFAEAIKEFTGSQCKISPISTKDFPTPARRPSYSVFDTDKIKQCYNIKIPEWKSSLFTLISKLKN